MSLVPITHTISDQTRKPTTDMQSPVDDPRQPAVEDVADSGGDSGKHNDADRLSDSCRVALDIFERIRIQLHRANYPVSKSHRTLHRLRNR